jgi:hypothetical protein
MVAVVTQNQIKITPEDILSKKMEKIKHREGSITQQGGRD